MKIVIDIPEEVYKCVMDGTWCGSLYEELKNGVPVEPDRKPGKWTPVSEGIPKPWESVLITFSGKYGNLTADHAVGIGSWDGSNGWYFEEIEGYTDRLTVEAWMNLPESYKGE